MPIIKIELLKGRSPGQKKIIANALVDAFIAVEPHQRPESFNVLFTEVEKANWAVGHDMMSEKYPDK